MHGDSGFIAWLPWIGALLAFPCLLGALRGGKRKRLVDNLPTSKTTGVFIGLVELHGSAEAEQPLTSYLAEAGTVLYSWTVSESWSRVVTETYTDGDGNTQMRTRVESGWATVASGGESIPFYLQDEFGAVRIVPAGANLEAVTIFDVTCTPLNSLYYGKGPAFPVADSSFTRRFHETAIPLHQPIYVMGQAREREDVVAPEIAEDKSAPMFLISTRSEQEISSGFGGAFWGWGLAGLLPAVAGLIVHDVAMDFDLGQRWPLYLLTAFGYGLACAAGWSWMVYNSMIDLRQRVRQGWSQVDVQLKRRHDLIPNLVQAVSGYRDYERNLQTELAQLRTQLGATPPGVAGADYAACGGSVLAIAERFPELKADKSFAALQTSLIETEQRIALARGYFNEIATHYNTRLEQVPDRFIAALGHLQPQALLQASSFERQAVEVKFAE
jgi:hypothetical protein